MRKLYLGLLLPSAAYGASVAASASELAGIAGENGAGYRAYSDGFARGIDSNHRITTNQAVVARGWISEGVVMCAPS